MRGSFRGTEAGSSAEDFGRVRMRKRFEAVGLRLPASLPISGGSVRSTGQNFHRRDTHQKAHRLHRGRTQAVKGYAIIPSTATRRNRVAQQASPLARRGFRLFYTRTGFVRAISYPNSATARSRSRSPGVT
jgi:hypothetical protein